MPNSRARELRRSMTNAERRLWSVLRSRRLSGYKFRRQHAIGPFFAGFACIGHKLIVEADGGQHNDSMNDQRRTAWLGREGWRVLRFWNTEILANPTGVAHAIVQALEEGGANSDPHPPASRRAPPSPVARERG